MEDSLLRKWQLPIKQLTNIELNDDLGINARECAHRIKIGKDNVYTYYRLSKQELSIEEIYSNYNIAFIVK